jgi:hypothetical protein
MTIDEVMDWCRRNNRALRANGAVHIPPTADEILADEVMRLRRDLAAAERERDMYRAIAQTGQL